MFNKNLIIITIVLFSSYLLGTPHNNVEEKTYNLVSAYLAEDNSLIAGTSLDINDTPTDNNSSIDDSSQADPDSVKSWSYHASISIQNKAIQKGEVTANGNALMQLETGISYKKLAFTAAFGKEAFANVWTDYTLGLNYTFSLAKWLDFKLGANQFNYIQDTMNIFSDNSNSVQSNLIFKLWDFSLDIGYQHLFGTSPVNYLSFNLNYTKTIGDFEIGMSADATSSDYTDKAKKNLNRHKRLAGSKSMIYTGMLSLSYSLPYNLNIGASGGVTQDFRGKVQPIFSVALGYYLDF